MTTREIFPSGAQWENKVGYSRAVKVGNVIEVSGTVAVKNGEVIGRNDPYLQTKCILEIVAEILKKAGATMADVVRTRMFVTDVSKWEEVGRAHGEVFASIKPATSMVEVSNLIAPEYLVEIEVSAILP